VIREYLTRLTQCDQTAVYRYSTAAARWEALRLLIDQGKAAPADEHKFRQLSVVLRGLTAALGLPVATEDHHGPDAIVGLTSWSGLFAAGLLGFAR
jgi:hypothetical protein